MKKAIIYALRFALCAFVAFATNSARADVQMTMFVSSSCQFCHNAEAFVDATLKHEYPMLKIRRVVINDATPAESEEYAKAWQDCKFPHGGVPIFIANGKCVQGYGPAVESDKELRDMLDAALTASDKKIVLDARAKIAANADAYKPVEPNVAPTVLADEHIVLSGAPDNKLTAKLPIIYFGIAGVIGALILAGIAYLILRNRKRKMNVVKKSAPRKKR